MQIIAQIEFKMTKMEILERFFSKIIYLIYLDIKREIIKVLGTRFITSMVIVLSDIA